MAQSGGVGRGAMLFLGIVLGLLFHDIVMSLISGKSKLQSPILGP